MKNSIILFFSLFLFIACANEIETIEEKEPTTNLLYASRLTLTYGEIHNLILSDLLDNVEIKVENGIEFNLANIINYYETVYYDLDDSYSLTDYNNSKHGIYKMQEEKLVSGNLINRLNSDYDVLLSASSYTDLEIKIAQIKNNFPANLSSTETELYLNGISVLEESFVFWSQGNGANFINQHTKTNGRKFSGAAVVAADWTACVYSCAVGGVAVPAIPLGAAAVASAGAALWQVIF